MISRDYCKDKIMPAAYRTHKISWMSTQFDCNRGQFNFLYFRFCKNAIFLNLSNIMCFCRFAFFLFFPLNFLSRRSTDLHQIWHEYVSLLWLDKDEGDLWKVQKPGHNGQKHRKIGQSFTPVATTFSFVVTKRLKIFEKSFLWWHLGCYAFRKMSLR